MMVAGMASLNLRDCSMLVTVARSERAGGVTYAAGMTIPDWIRARWGLASTHVSGEGTQPREMLAFLIGDGGWQRDVKPGEQIATGAW